MSHNFFSVGNYIAKNAKKYRYTTRTTQRLVKKTQRKLTINNNRWTRIYGSRSESKKSIMMLMKQYLCNANAKVSH